MMRQAAMALAVLMLLGVGAFVATPAHAGDMCWYCLCARSISAIGACTDTSPGFSEADCTAACAPDAGSPTANTGITCAEKGSCPQSELGHCSDGVNNDAYLNDLTDCADPACIDDPACRLKAPAISHANLTFVGVLLLGGGVYLLRRRVAW